MMATEWPPEDRMPPEFSPETIMELGRNPGLGVWKLHENGIDGHGVGIALIDQALLVDHREYVHRLKWYDEVGMPDLQSASFHGPAVASIAAGRTVGVAPGADLYYFRGNELPFYLHNFAVSIRRIIQLNDQLPEDRKIRIISISSGWMPEIPGYYDIMKALDEAKAQGIFVVSSNLEQDYGYGIYGLGRSPLADPDDFESYQSGHFWESDFYSGSYQNDRLLVPMDSRTVARPTGIDDYSFERHGGISWSVPYLAGVYALALQTDPSITPEIFLSLALKTGRTIKLVHEGQVYMLGPIIDPNAIITALNPLNK